MRRGRPTSHVKFGEDVAILAGDGLFAEAIRLVCDRQEGEPERVLAALAELTAAAGVGGMVGGQYVDVTQDAELDAERLRELHSLKTGRLIAASVLVPLRLTGADEAATIPYRHYAEELGVLFQIVDDILDVTGSDAELGKPHGSDERHGKLTYVSLFGLDRARELAAAFARSGTRGPRGDRRRHGRPRADHRLHPHPPEMTDEQPATSNEQPLLAGVHGPEDLKGMDDEQLTQLAQEVREQIIDTIGEIGGHFGANLGTCELATVLHALLSLAARQDPLGRRPPGLPAQDPHRAPRPALDDPPVRGARAVLLDRRVRARHHGRRPRLDLDRLRGRSQGGDAPRDRRGRQGRRGDRRRRADRRRRVRGAAQRGRAADAGRDRAERQRDVDLAERRRALALLQLGAPEPPPLPGARGRRVAADQAAAGPRPADRAARARSSRRPSRRTGRRASCSRSSTSRTSAWWTATT